MRAIVSRVVLEVFPYRMKVPVVGPAAVAAAAAAVATTSSSDGPF